MSNRRPVCSLSLDLDNQWSYMKVHGDAGWESHPSYLDVVIPRFVDLLREFDTRITVFVVGQDAALSKNHEALQQIAAAGHEIGNHSFHHEPWMAKYSAAEVRDELVRAEQAIEGATGVRPTGFRGPGFALSPAILETLWERGYQYDASTFPTFIGPLARAYYFMHATLSADEADDRSELFGTVRDGLRPLDPYRWRLREGELLEIPVTTWPMLRMPMHISYVQYLAVFSRPLAMAYFRAALRACRATGTDVSLLLHPLDFLGAEDCPELAFFPAMDVPANRKLDLMRDVLDVLTRRFEVVPMGEHAARCLVRETMHRAPDFRRAS